MMDIKTNFKTIYSTLKEDIINGTYLPGSLLPTEQMLAEKYSVSRPTIAKVNNQLQIEGYISKKKGLGTVVTYEEAKLDYTLGLLLPGAGESEIFSIINDQLLRLSESGRFNCLWEGATASSAEIRRSLIETCCENYIKKKVDGILFSPLERVANANKINLQVCEEMSKAGIPIVLIDRDIVKYPERSCFDIVSIDNFSAGSIMAKHLIDAGCETIHFFYRPDSATSVNLRLSGVRDAVLESNLPFDSGNAYCGDPASIEFVRQMKINPGKTGIICANDSTAAVLMSSLDAIGIKITSDVLICGYDDMKYSEHLKYSLTSFKQPCEEMANISIELIMRRIKQKDLIPITVNLTGKIVVRASSNFERK